MKIAYKILQTEFFIMSSLISFYAIWSWWVERNLSYNIIPASNLQPNAHEPELQVFYSVVA